MHVGLVSEQGEAARPLGPHQVSVINPSSSSPLCKGGNNLSVKIFRSIATEILPYFFFFPQSSALLRVSSRAAGMSFGVGIGDALAVSKLALGIWGRIQDSSDQFKAIRTE